jgi:uncharacterized protein YggU (UPF0235/DUF167 family)
LRITIALKSRPERNKANREIIAKLAEYFGTSKDIEFVSLQV